MHNIDDTAFSSFQRRDDVWALRSSHHYYGSDTYSVGTPLEVASDVTWAMRTYVWRNIGRGGWAL